MTPEDRHLRNGHRGAVVWFTGLSGSGKSTLARALERDLFTRGRQVVVLDGDQLRTGLSADLGFTTEQRSEQIRRVAEVARLFAEAGLIAISALICAYRDDRERARGIVERGSSGIPFLEVYLSTPLAVCEARDPKNLYTRARAGDIPAFTGVSAPFEPPGNPDVAIDTSRVTVDESVGLVGRALAPRVLLHAETGI